MLTCAHRSAITHEKRMGALEEVSPYGEGEVHGQPRIPPTHKFFLINFTDFIS